MKFCHWRWGNCGNAEAIERSLRAQDVAKVCFDGETHVHIRLDESTYKEIGKHLRPDPRYPSMIGVPLVCEIQYLVPGVEVLSRCEATGEIAYRKITKTFEHEPKDLCDLRYVSQAEHGNGSILVTGNHPFWIQGKGWVEVRSLQAGDKFVTYDDAPVEVRSLEKKNYGTPVYNIEVEQFHTYFVENAGIWVHNKNQQVSVEALNPNKFPDALR